MEQDTLALSNLQLVKAQWRVISALLLQDIRSRFGGNPIGYFAMGVGWPLSHILILLLINAGLGRAPPYGDSAALWYATGVIPFMAFQYMARFISLGVVINRSLLSLPAVKLTDLMFARVVAEFLNAGMVVIIMFGILSAMGVPFIPNDIVQASLALGSMMLLGAGFGVINGVIGAIVPFWVTGYALLQIIFWLAAGIVFVPDALPEVAKYPLSFFPPLQGVEWMRSAYYDGLGSGILSKSYLIGVALASLCLGLLMERLLRGRAIR